MNKINEIIQRLCPNGVEYVLLEDVCRIEKGVQFNKKDMCKEGTYPVINGGINPSGYIEQYNQNENTITISQGGASAGYVNWLQTKFWAGAHCYVLKPTGKILNRYLFHFVKLKEHKLQECQYGAGIPALGKSTVASLKVPVPPIEIQKEIVRILDKFNSLSSDLENGLPAEIEARTKQYEFYRNQLLSFEPVNICSQFVNVERERERERVRWINPSNLVEYKTLNDICSIQRGKSLSKADTGTGENPIILYGELYTSYGNYINNIKSFANEDRIKHSVIAKRNDLLLPISSTTKEAQIGKVSILNVDTPVHIGGDTLILKHSQHPGYLMHYLNSGLFENEKMKCVKGTTISHLSVEKLANIKIPIPPLEVQEYIASILNRFDSLCNDIFEGLPAEIELRNKQYEYYRNKLLNFVNKGERK